MHNTLTCVLNTQSCSHTKVEHTFTHMISRNTGKSGYNIPHYTACLYCPTCIEAPFPFKLLRLNISVHLQSTIPKVMGLIPSVAMIPSMAKNTTHFCFKERSGQLLAQNGQVPDQVMNL